MFHECGPAAEQVHQGYGVFAMMRTEVIAGQYLDLVSGVGDGSVASALTVIRMKAARYTVTRPLQIGAALAGAGAGVAGRARRRSAIRSATRSSCATTCSASSATRRSPASPILDDLREGKPTVMMALARGSADRDQAAPAQGAVRQPGPGPEGRRRAAADHRRHRRPGPDRADDQGTDGRRARRVGGRAGLGGGSSRAHRARGGGGRPASSEHFSPDRQKFVGAICDRSYRHMSPELIYCDRYHGAVYISTEESATATGATARALPGRPRQEGTVPCLIMDNRRRCAVGRRLRAAARRRGADAARRDHRRPPQAHTINATDFQQVTLAKGVAEVGEPMSLAVLPDRSVLHTARNGTLRRTDAAGNTTRHRHHPRLHARRGRAAGRRRRPGLRQQPAASTSTSRRRCPPRPVTRPPPAPSWTAWQGVNRLARFTLNADFTLNMGSQVTVLDVPADRGHLLPRRRRHRLRRGRQPLPVDRRRHATRSTPPATRRSTSGPTATRRTTRSARPATPTTCAARSCGSR